MSAKSWEIRARRNVIQDETEILIKYGDDAYVKSFALEAMRPYDGTAPTFGGGGLEGGEEFLRCALNCAWELGLRPDGYLDTRESLRATDAHLQDMRALAFHKIGAQKP